MKEKKATKKQAREWVCETSKGTPGVPRVHDSGHSGKVLLLPGLFRQQLDLAQGGAQEGKGGRGVHSLLLRDGGGVQEDVYLPVSGT